MDDIVRQAMAKWPNVPHCHGWLGLDSRGHWYMRDDRAQAAGPFASIDGGTRDSRGSLLRHDKLIEFIHRNYGADPHGQWYFQNGPQRVYVELESTPWILRIDPKGEIQTHTGRRVEATCAWMDEQGRAYLETDSGLGLVHTLDVNLLAAALDAGRWPLHEVESAELPRRFGYVRSPQAAVQHTASPNKKPA